MKQKRLQKKLLFCKETVANLVEEEQKQAKGGYVTYLSGCCTKNMATCIPDPEGCNPADTYQPGGTACP